MKLKVFTLRLNPENGLFDDAEVTNFQQGREILDVSDYQFNHDRVPTWALLVRYRDQEEPVFGKDQSQRKDWRADLDPQQRHCRLLQSLDQRLW